MNLTLEMLLGRDVRDLRKASGLTISRLAELTGLSVGYLSEIERGVSKPSERALLWIATALKVTPDWFRNQSEGDDAVADSIVVRSGTHRSIVMQSGLREDLLVPNLSRRLELTRTIIPPGTRSSDLGRSHEGEEAGFVLSGGMTLWVGDRVMELREGDGFAFNARETHRVANFGDVDAVVIWAQTPPMF